MFLSVATNDFTSIDSTVSNAETRRRGGRGVRGGVAACEGTARPGALPSQNESWSQQHRSNHVARYKHYTGWYDVWVRHPRHGDILSRLPFHYL